MSHHLIIGLGGTGGKILASYKRLLFENKKGEIDTSKFDVELMYVDSSGEDLKMRTKMWNIMGTDLSLNKAQVVEIMPTNIRPFIENAENYSNLKNWVGSIEGWKDIIYDSDFQRGAGGQRRRLGRLNFAINANDDDNNFALKLSEIINKLKKPSPLTFHICAGLAGGTGSGTFIDVCAQIRKKYSDIKNYPIILYLVPPEKIPDPKYATTKYYQANGYAALMELNALAFSDFLPSDICETGVDVGRVSLKDVAFNLAYIITEKNEHDITYFIDDPNKAPVGSLVQTISEFLYQRTITKNTEILQKIGRAEPMENKDDQNPSKYKFSRKFFTFGYKRFAIPEQEIKEYYSYFFGYQALLQFLFSNYDTTDGYIDKTKSESFYSDVSNNSFLEKFNLTRDHLCLSREVLDEYKKEIRGISINDDIQLRLNKITEEIKQGNSIDGRPVKKEQWLDAIYYDGFEYYKKGFRLSGQDGGVDEFYTRKRKDKDSLAKKIVDNLERTLFQEDWNGGRISLTEISGIVNALNKYLSDEKEKFDDLISINLQRIKIVEQELVSMKADWRPGWINNIFNDNEGKVKGTQKGTTEIIQLKTWNRAYDYAKELIEAINLQLSVLASNISFVIGILTGIKKEFMEEHYSRCKDEYSEDKSDAIIKYYDPRKLKNFAVILSQNKEKLDEKISYLRNQLYKTTKSESSFFEKLKKLNKEFIIEELKKETIALTNSFFANEAEIKELTDDKFIGENILAKLQDDYSGDDEGLKNKVKDLISQASLLAIFDKEQQDDDKAGSITSRMVILPEIKGPESEKFKEKIENYFKDNQPHCEVEYGGNSNEIVVFNIKRGIQVRSFETVSVLKESYYKLMNSLNKERAKFFCHLEDIEILNETPNDAQLQVMTSKNMGKSIVYNLFPLKRDEINKLNVEVQNKTLPYLLIAKATDVIRCIENTETGKKVLCLIKTTDFSSTETELDKTLEASVSKIDVGNSDIIINEVMKKLKADYRHIDKQNDLKKRMLTEVEQMQQRFDNNPLNATVKRFKQAGEEAVNIIKNINT